MTDRAPLKLSVGLDRPRLMKGNAARIHLVAELTAPADALARAPLSLVLALDTSGSMEGEKLRHVIASVELLIAQLSPHDRLGLVGFSHAARALLPLSPADAGLKGRVCHALAALRAEGGTHVEAGLRCSAQLLGPRDAERRSAVILLSDGQPNAGAMTAKALGRSRASCAGSSRSRRLATGTITATACCPSSPRRAAAPTPTFRRPSCAASSSPAR